MASHYSYGNRETLIIAIILDALLMVFCIFLIIDVLKRYYLQFPMVLYTSMFVRILFKTSRVELCRVLHVGAMTITVRLCMLIWRAELTVNQKTKIINRYGRMRPKFGATMIVVAKLVGWGALKVGAGT